MSNNLQLLTLFTLLTMILKYALFGFEPNISLFIMSVIQHIVVGIIFVAIARFRLRKRKSNSK